MEQKIQNIDLVVPLSDEIEQLFTERPDKRRKKDYEVWRKEINFLIDKCNKLAKHKLYETVK